MAAELAGGCELTELVAYHIFRYVNRDKLVAVVYGYGMANEIGRNH